METKAYAIINTVKKKIILFQGLIHLIYSPPPMTQNSNSKITIHMVSSLNGFIAKKNNNISWFETADDYEKGVEYSEEQTKEFLKTIDCYVMGARTYEHAAELSKTYGWPYGEVPTIVLSHKNPQPIKWNIEIYSGDLH